jgi:hypothetical protein
MGTQSTPSAPTKSLTSEDLAFIDAAIAMKRATLMTKKQPGASAVAVEPSLFIGIIQLVVAVVEVATFVYHAVKGSIPISQLAGVDTGVSSDASLKDLIAKRNELAKALGDPSVLS